MYYFQFYVALWTDKPLRVIEKEKYRSSGEPFCSEAKLSDEKVLARQSRLHGKFAARLAEIPRSRDPSRKRSTLNKMMGRGWSIPIYTSWVVDL